MKNNWLIINGIAEVGKGVIKYIPSPRKNEQTGTIETTPAYLRSSIFFNSGQIRFTVKIKNPLSQCQVILGTDTGMDLWLGVNTLGVLYGIVKYKALNQSWDLLNGAGDPRIAQPNAEYDIRICVVGSKITLYVNDVLAASAEHIIRETQFQIYMNSDDEITIKDFEVSLDPSKVFVIMQFTEEYNQLYSEVVKPVCEQYGLKCERGDDYCTTTMIIQDIADSINEASVVIAEITPDNPNVFYEVGYAHASKKPTILLCDKKRPKLPFDISSFRTLFYDNTIAGKTKVETDLRKYLDTILNKS